MDLKSLRDAAEQDRGFSMLPDDFDFAQLPKIEGAPNTFSLKEVGMLASSIETIDYAITSWLKSDLDLRANTNEGFTRVPVLWQSPERAFQVKNKKELRDDGDALKLPLISIERTGITKDPTNKGGFQAHIYSDKKNGRTGRMVIAKRVKQDKTRNFAVASGTRTGKTNGVLQQHYPRVNNKVVVQYLSIPIPIYVNIQYKIIIKSQYQQQMNELMEPFLARTGQINSFILKRDGHMYEAFMDQSFNHTNNVSNLGEDERLFSSEIGIRVLGYLIGEGVNDDRPIVRVDESVVEVTFPRESAVVPGNPSLFGD
jgi:hypothetical protein